MFNYVTKVVRFAIKNPLNPAVHFWLHHTTHNAEKIGGGGWCHLQDDMHMVAARVGCQSAMVGTRWANSYPGCMEGLRKCYSHLVEGSFRQGRLLGL